MSAYQLVWFRQDLRIVDHSALWHARQTGPCIALVTLSPVQWRQHDDAVIKIDLYLRQLKVLKEQLKQLNIPIIIKTIPLWKEVPEFLLECCQSLSVQQIHAHIEAGINEQQRDQDCQQLLDTSGIALTLYQDRTLFPFGSITNQNGQPYQVFGAFKKACYSRLEIALPKCYTEITAQNPITLPALDQFQQTAPDIRQLCDIPVPESIQQLWPACENHAHTLLEQFLENHIQHYHIERDFPAHSGTSQLSAYLNIGVLSIRQCIQALFRHQSGYFVPEQEGQSIWLDELLWREFYQHILYLFPNVSKYLPFKANAQNIPWQDDKTALTAWQQGQTGIPIVDAGMRQLLVTGWMHNRVRMITAMFLCKNLLIDWRQGEQWFMQHLIDGDLAANNGGWQWCASTGTDSVPYFRIFNPVSQSRKFDPEGQYIRTWIPELAHLDAKTIHAPYESKTVQQLDYPKPIVDLKYSRARAIDHFKQYL